MLRGSRGDAAGAESGCLLRRAITVNTGTVPGLPAAVAASVAGRAGRTVGRSGRGGAEPP